MLKILKIEGSANKHESIVQLLSNEPSLTFITADLNSKKYWEARLGENHSIFRVRDFWNYLFKSNFPDLIIISKQVFPQILKIFLKNDLLQKFDLINLKTNTLQKYFEELFPIFSHPNNEEVMQEWFANQEENKCSWKNIYLLCQEIWFLLQSKKWIPESCITAYLINTVGTEFYWRKPILIDLGAHIESLESELIIILSQKTNVYVLEPSADWTQEYYWLNWPYQQLRTRSFQETDVENKFKNNSKSDFIRAKTPLIEIFLAIEKIKNWLGAGVLPSEITVASPQIEKYWSSICWYLQKAKIPMAKEIQINYIDLPIFKKLINQLKCSYFYSVKKSDVEKAIYLEEEAPVIKFLEFEEKFSNIFSTQDFSRNPMLREQFAKEKLDEYFLVDDFLATVQVFWLKLQGDDLLWTEISEYFKKSIPEDIRWDIYQWVEIFELFLVHKEKIVLEEFTADPSGIKFISLAHVYFQHSEKIIVLGLNEIDVKSDTSVLPGSDVLSLLTQTGHLLRHQDRNQNEFYLNWIKHSEGEKIFIFSEINWKNQEQIPSFFWSLGCIELDKDITTSTKLAKPMVTENDRLSLDQNNENIKLNLNSKYSSFNESILQNVVLTPSTLELYLDCPYKFYAERILKLKEPHILDMDLSPMTSGSIYHSLCESLTKEPMNFELSLDEIKKIIESIIQKNNQKFIEDMQSQLVQEKLIIWAQEFLQNEKNWRLKHPNTKTVGREAAFFGNILGLAFNGKIDRIDSNGGEHISVIDYKSSVSGITSYKSWIKNNHLQILAYIYAIEKEWVPSFKNIQEMQNINVTAGYFLSLKDFEKKGFVLDDCDRHFVTDENDRNIISIAQKQELIKEFEECLYKIVQQIKDFKFEPNPLDKKECKKCYWSHLCQAPHLNL